MGLVEVHVSWPEHPRLSKKEKKGFVREEREVNVKRLYLYK